MIRRKKVTIFTDAKESTTVLDVKKIVEGILKQKPEDQKLYKDDQVNSNGYLWSFIKKLGEPPHPQLGEIPEENVLNGKNID